MKSKRSESWVPAALAGGLALFVLTISLFGQERESASRFLRPTFVSGNSGPEFAAPYVTRRVCVDRVHDGIATSTLNRAGYLDGGELVGAFPRRRPIQTETPWPPIWGSRTRIATSCSSTTPRRAANSSSVLPARTTALASTPTRSIRSS